MHTIFLIFEHLLKILFCIDVSFPILFGFSFVFLLESGSKFCPTFAKFFGNVSNCKTRVGCSDFGSFICSKPEKCRPKKGISIYRKKYFGNFGYLNSIRCLQKSVHNSVYSSDPNRCAFIIFCLFFPACMSYLGLCV